MRRFEVRYRHRLTDEIRLEEIDAFGFEEAVSKAYKFRVTQLGSLWDWEIEHIQISLKHSV